MPPPPTPSIHPSFLAPSLFLSLIGFVLSFLLFFISSTLRGFIHSSEEECKGIISVFARRYKISFKQNLIRRKIYVTHTAYFGDFVFFFYYQFELQNARICILEINSSVSNTISSFWKKKMHQKEISEIGLRRSIILVKRLIV